MESKAVVDELTGREAQVKVYHSNIANEDSFLSAMEQCSHQLPPIKGVIQMASTSGQGAAASLASRLTEADAASAPGIIIDALVKKTASILGIPPSEVDASRPMYQYGVDSLVALKVRNWITRGIKANFLLLEILAAVPMETLAAQVALKSKLIGGLGPS